MEGAGEVQPALVNAEGLDQVGVVLVKEIHFIGKLLIQPVVGREEDQVGALFLGLPDGLRRLDLEGLGGLVLGQNNPVAAVGVAAHRHRTVPQLRVGQQLHRGVKAVQIAVKNHPVHGRTSLCGHYTSARGKSQTHVLIFLDKFYWSWYTIKKVVCKRMI